MKFFKKIAACFTFGDLLIVLVVCALSLTPLLFMKGNMVGKTVVVEVDGKVYASVEMNSLGSTSKEIAINTKYGKNILNVDKNGADMTFSDCPLQIDVNHRKITAPGEVIVCAPHKVVVYITGESEFDAISG